MKIRFRMAVIDDLDLYFKWTNDSDVRQNSYNQEPIAYSDHVKWFTDKINSNECFFYLFFNDLGMPVGQVRIENNQEEITIGISVDRTYRGFGLGETMLTKATSHFLDRFPTAKITAYIKKENITSLVTFRKAGFADEGETVINGVKSCILSKLLS
jgi:RimJ/RimL family protein N-acetyltransferase